MQPNETHEILDRNVPRHYRIQNIVQEEWRPIIGKQGMDLYGLLVYFSSAQAEAYPSTRLIRQHLGLGFDAIRDYLRLLEWCQLLSTRTNSQPNRKATESKYIHTLLQPEKVTSAVLKNIELQLQRAENNPSVVMASAFPKLLRKRLDKWKSLRSRFRQKPKETDKPAKPDAPDLYEKTKQWLVIFGVEEKYRGSLAAKTKPYLVVACVWNAALSGKRVNNIGGYLNTVLRRSNPKLRDGLSTLALAYDKADTETRLQMELGIQIDDPQLIKMLSENGSALKAARMLWQRYETIDPIKIMELM